MSDENKRPALWVENIVSGKSFEPLIHIKLDDIVIGQMSVDEARQHAAQVFECAEAAESDAFVFKWLSRDIIGSDQDHRDNWDQIINEFKQFRDARRASKE